MKQMITPNELSVRIAAGERFQIVDVRSAREYAEGHLPGALHLPLEEVEARIDDVQPHDEVVVVCWSGKRAGMACEQLHPHRGNVTVLSGGTEAWMQAGLPTVATTRARLPLMRQVHLIAGALILIGTLLSLLATVAWVGLAMFVGAGLFVAGATGFCGMATLLAKMPWNRAAPCAPRPTPGTTASAR